jgi:DNA-binding NarL/FixJ family response regulator
MELTNKADKMGSMKRKEVPVVNQGEHLLLIDDEPAVLKTLRFWLESEGYQVHTAESREEAMELLQEFPVSVCLIDLKMDNENGLEISRELRKIDSLLKIIIITGHPDYESAIEAMKIGVFDYASKGMDNKDILKKITDAIEARKNHLESKRMAISDRKSIILACHHVMIEEGFETFCSENSKFYLAHTYHSTDYIKSGDFSSTASLVLICSTCNPDLLTQPDEMLRKLHLLFPRSALVMINCNPDDEVKKKLIKLGVKGFLPKNISKDNMKKAFNTILSGQIWVSRKVAHELLTELLEQTSKRHYVSPRNPYNLSNREIEILQAIASGLSNCAISEKLFISEKTVKAHINNLFKKMSVKSRTQAVKKAVEEHVI